MFLPTGCRTLFAAACRPIALKSSVIPTSAKILYYQSTGFHTTAVTDKRIPKIPMGLSELDDQAVFNEWREHNKVVYPPTKEGEPLRPAEVTHLRHSIKYSKKKMWYPCVMCRGMSVEEALKQLKFYNKKGAGILAEIIEEAMDMAVKEHNVEYRLNLWIADCTVTRGITFRGYRKSMGARYSPINFNHCNVFLRLREGKPPEQYYKGEMSGHEKVQDYIENHRSRRIYGAL